MSSFAVPACLLACLIVVSGCANIVRGQPQQNYGDPSRPKSLEKIVLQERLSEEFVKAALGAPLTETRDQIIFARLAEIDVLYNDYETALLTESRQADFLLSFGGLLAGLAGGFSTGQTSQIYSLIGGGLGAAQTSYTKEILAEQTIQAFVSQMRAARAAVKVELFDNLRGNVLQYPIEAALGDLQRYRQAGTIITAVSGITDSAARLERSQENFARRAANQLLTVDRKPINRNQIVVDVQDYVAGDPVKRAQFAECYEKATAGLSEDQKPAFSGFFFSNGASFIGLPERVARCLNDEHNANITIEG